MESAAQDYAAFEDKVKRTVYVDNLSHSVTIPVLRSAFDQFGDVKTVCFIPNYLNAKGMPLAALIEMESPKQAEQIILGMSNSPFMVCGMPRPIRARPAEPHMFDDRPRKPDRRIHFHWLDPKDPDIQVAKKIKNVVRRHHAEAKLVLEKQLDAEKKLATTQAETLRTNYKKYETIENVIADGVVDRLARRYKMPKLTGRDAP